MYVSNTLFAEVEDMSEVLSKSIKAGKRRLTPRMSKALPEGPLTFVHGDDDFAVAQRARQIYHGWCDSEGGEDNEIIEAHSANAGEAVKALGRLHEAIDTLPFFGGGKVVWFKGCNFLGTTGLPRPMTSARAGRSGS